MYKKILFRFCLMIVLIGALYMPMQVQAQDHTPVAADRPQPIMESAFEQPSSASDAYLNWISAMELIAPALLIGLALLVYFIHKKHHTQTKKRSGNSNFSNHK